MIFAELLEGVLVLLYRDVVLATNFRQGALGLLTLSLHAATVPISHG